MSIIFPSLRRWIGALTIALIVCFGAQPFDSIAVTYAYTNTSFAYDTPSGSASTVVWHTGTAAPACTNYPNGDDDWADLTFGSGFTFTFGGVNYSSVRIYSNGMLVFGTDTSGFHRIFTPTALPITATGGTFTGCTSGTPANLMVVYWIDIVAGTANNTTGASIQYELLGTAPNRRFVISWNNVKLYNQTTRYNFQVALYESAAGVNGNFKYQYTSGSSTGANATVGVQLTSADYTQYSFNQTFIDTTNGTAILWYPANQLAAKGAEYRFDESVWAGVAGEIKDTSGSNQNASKVGLALSGPNGTLVTSGGKLCRGGVFTSNTSNITIDAVATPITPANQGSVSFWYKSNVAWNTADTMLIDASPSAAKPFFLMKMSTGALKFTVTDSAGNTFTAQTSTAYTFAANTWQHIAISWNFRTGTNQTVQQIMLNGALVTTNTTTPFRSTTSGTIATLSTIYIGDNRTSGVTPTGGTPNGANGGIDEVYIYPIEINYTQEAADAALTRTTCTSLDHFHIIHSGSQVACDVANVTVEAHDVNHALFSLAGTTIQMSTSTGNGSWSSVSTINPVTSAGGGNGSYVFANESTVIFGLSDPNVESVNINLVSGTVTEKTGAAAVCVSQDYTFGTTCDANLSFTQAGFIVSSSAGGASTSIANVVAGITSPTYYLRSVQFSTATKACTAALTGTQSINLGYECNNPISCSASNLMTIDGGTPTVISRNNNNSVSSYTAVSLTFDTNGNAPFTLNFADVGAVKLWATKTLASGAVVSGSSNSFISTPYSFLLSNIKTTSSGFANPGATTATGAVFMKAGDNFSATVTAIAQSGAATPNYGKETSPQTVTLTPALVGGLGLTSNPGITNANVFGPFTNGVATGTTFSWGEVGIITLTPSVAGGSYLGTGSDAFVLTPSGNVGRFVPYSFGVSGSTSLLNRSDMSPACSPASTFTYLDESFQLGFTLNALNQAGGTTANYAGAFAKLPLTTPSVWSLQGIAGTVMFPSGTRMISTASSGSWSAGTAAVTLTAQAARATAPDGPHTILMGIAPTDSDGVAMGTLDLDTDYPANGNDRKSVGSVKAYFGRIKVSNGMGSQNRPLRLPISVQSYTTSAQTWSSVANTFAVVSGTDVDACTISHLNSSAFSFGNYRRTLTSADSVVSSIVDNANGTGYIVFQKPGGSRTGTFDFAISLGSAATDASCLQTWTPTTAATAGVNMPYLRGYWCAVGGAGPYYVKDPSARISFGLYGGSDRFVYQRENF